MKIKWHELALDKIESELDTDLSGGLSVREARRRLEKGKKGSKGTASLFVRRTDAEFTSVFSFFFSPAVLVLVLVSLFAALFGDLSVGLGVLVIALSGSLIGGIMKMRARKKINSMHDFSSPAVRVVRGGKKYYTDGRNVVKGDVFVVKSGDLLVCDARIISSDSLTVKELFNTAMGVRNRDVQKSGEASYSESDTVDAPNASNMLYAGSVVSGGRALCVAVETGEDVYLSRFLGAGELSGYEGEYGGVKAIRPILQRVCFFSLVAVVLLSLVSLITLKETSFVHNFAMLLSSVAMISLELVETVAASAFACCIERSARVFGEGEENKRDIAAFIRDVKAIDTLTDVSDLILLGDAALFEGGFRFGEVCVGERVLCTLSADDPSGSRILTYAHSYLRALAESGIENEFLLDGVADSLSNYVRSSNFDAEGADLVIRSLYFSADASGERGFACVETTLGEYRAALSFDESVLALCKSARGEMNEKCELADVKDGILDFRRDVEGRGGRCLYFISESGGETFFEGALAVYRVPAAELSAAIEALGSSRVTVRALLFDEEGLTSSNIVSALDGEVAYASDFAARGVDILDNTDKYGVYVGFSADEYARLIDRMRENGSVVAAYGIGDEYYDVMARANLAVSCDVLKYSSEKYKESLYEKLPCDGRETNLRCSQKTRLLSRMLVHRSHKGSGGLNAILNALNASRSAYLSLAQSLLIFIMLMSTLLPIIAVSAVTGVYLLNAIQTAALAFSAALISIIVFSDSVSKDSLLKSSTDFKHLPTALIRYKLPGIIARASLSAVFALVLLILDLAEVFGKNTAYSMPVFIALLLTVFVEFFIINNDYTASGEGRRRCFVRVLLIYAALLAVAAVITLPPLSDSLFPNGIGGYEFIIVPAYCLLYTVTVFVARRIESKRKK